MADILVADADNDVDSCQVDKELDLPIEGILGQHMEQVLVENYQAQHFRELEQKLRLVELALVDSETLLEIEDLIDCY